MKEQGSQKDTNQMRVINDRHEVKRGYIYIGPIRARIFSYQLGEEEEEVC